MLQRRIHLRRREQLERLSFKSPPDDSPDYASDPDQKTAWRDISVGGGESFADGNGQVVAEIHTGIGGCYRDSEIEI